MSKLDKRITPTPKLTGVWSGHIYEPTTIIKFK